MHTFEIDRNHWGRGESRLYSSQLFNKNSNKMCCLGFYALSMGISKEAITSIGSPSNLNEASKKLIPSIVTGRKQSTVCHTLICVNDRKSDVDREKELTEAFKEIDVEVTFTGDSNAQV